MATEFLHGTVWAGFVTGSFVHTTIGNCPGFSIHPHYGPTDLFIKYAGGNHLLLMWFEFEPEKLSESFHQKKMWKFRPNTHGCPNYISQTSSRFLFLSVYVRSFDQLGSEPWPAKWTFGQPSFLPDREIKWVRPRGSSGRQMEASEVI